MTNAELYLATKTVINMVYPEVKVIKSYQSKRAPSGLYAVVNTEGVSEYKYIPLVDLNNSEEVTSPIGEVVNVEHDVKQQLVSQVIVNFYRENANEVARDLLNANWLPEVNLYMMENNFAWERVDPVVNLSSEINGKYEERAQIDIFVLHEHTKKQTTNAIYSAEVVITEDENTVADFEVKAPTN